MPEASYERAQAAKCRAVATEVDEQTAANLLMLAQGYEDEARRKEAAPDLEIRPFNPDPPRT